MNNNSRPSINMITNLIAQATVVRRLYFVCTMIVLQPLAKAMDIFLFYTHEKYVKIGGSALRLIWSYFYDRTQIVQIDFAGFLCGRGAQCSVLGPMIFFVFASTWCDT